jgi:hypothetical protein
MDYDDAAPPAIRRSPRAALERQIALRQAREADDDFDEAAPSVPRSRAASLENGPALQHNSPASNFNPLRSHPVDPLTSHPVDPGLTASSRHRFSHPFWEQLAPFQADNSSAPIPTPPALPRRSPARLKSFRSNKRLPPHLRHRTSLETINSVTTTASNASDDEEPDPLEARAPSLYSFTLEDDPASTPVPPSDSLSLASSYRSSSTNSQQSVKPPFALVRSRDSEPHSPKSLFRKMTHRKPSDATSVPERLLIERKVSFDRSSHRSSLSGSNQSLPLEQSSSPALLDAPSQSGSSSGWSASNFDITSLSESEIKKCKKKGINPALFAEMKAARKGKWTSPIAGNTFL